MSDFVGKVAVVEQAGRAVRLLCHEGETLYAARDILGACGMKYPEKWCQREAKKTDSTVKLKKLMFPVNGKNGGASGRCCPMYFTTDRSGRAILSIVGCDKSTREWLEKEVFSHKIEESDPDPHERIGGVADAGCVEKRIDAILFELLDLKKYIAESKI